ncbi:MAG: DUF481 domain-containing protein [Pedobacter sp.]|nr:DUF481 domain-containing protein [Pedobacter sp.]
MSLNRFVLFLALALPATAFSYESIESDTISPPVDGGSGNIRGAIDGRSGNTERVNYTVGGRVNYRSRDTDMFALVEHSRAKADDTEIENASWAHLHYRDEFKRGLAAEAFLDGHKDDFQLLDSRLQLGGGLRFTLNYEPDVRAVYAGIGALYEWEDQAGRDDDYWRLNAYFAYKRQLNQQVRALFDLYYQPSLSEGRDYLIKTELGVLVKLAEQLDLKMGVRYQYDGDAPTGIESDDTAYITALNFHF